MEGDGGRMMELYLNILQHNSYCYRLTTPSLTLLATPRYYTIVHRHLTSTERLVLLSCSNDESHASPLSSYHRVQFVYDLHMQIFTIVCNIVIIEV